MTARESQAFIAFVGTVRSVQGSLAWYAADYNTNEIKREADRLDEAISKVYKTMNKRS